MSLVPSLIVNIRMKGIQIFPITDHIYILYENVPPLGNIIKNESNIQRIDDEEGKPSNRVTDSYI